ncbi:MFS transporter [Nocardioides mesophilus]|uniref:MFS transporter n=1 Tax=Nocardioides mesophilus TaxID=433659 RepID=UPI001FEADC9A|nr:MFS transporter [Nocardioides mesophilus]
MLAARTIPMVLFLLFGGVIADRFPRTLVLQLSNVLSALTQGVVAFLVITGQAELWMLVVLEAANGTVWAISFPAMSGMLPQLVRRDQLQSANALLSLSRGGLTVLGPTIGALLVVTVGAGWALAVDALTWAVASLLLMPVRIPPRRASTEKSSTLSDLREGWSLFVGTTWLWVVVLSFSVLNAIHSGAWFTLGPALAKKTIGEQGWGLVLSAESVGLLLMTLVLLRVRLRRPLLVGMLGCSLMGIPMIVLGVQPHLLTLVLLTVVAGAGIEVFSMAWNLAMQENIEDRMLSRAYSYDALGSFVAMPVGQLVYGPLGEAFGFRDVLLWSGIGYVAVALLTLSSRSVRRLERAAPVPAAAAATTEV